MAESSQQGKGASPLNLSSFVAILMLFGGVWFVSQKLTSERPVGDIEARRDFHGEQTPEARLWEDPFKTDVLKRSETHDDTNAAGFDILLEQIHERSNSTNRRVLLLPVMFP